MIKPTATTRDPSVIPSTSTPSSRHLRWYHFRVGCGFGMRVWDAGGKGVGRRWEGVGKGVVGSCEGRGLKEFRNLTGTVTYLTTRMVSAVPPHPRSRNHDGRMWSTVAMLSKQPYTRCHDGALLEVCRRKTCVWKLGRHQPSKGISQQGGPLLDSNADVRLNTNLPTWGGCQSEQLYVYMSLKTITPKK